MDIIPYPSESQFLAFIRANYLDLFPKLVDQSQFNRRARSLRLLVEALRRNWLIQLGVLHRFRFLIDTKPIPVVGFRRSKKHGQFAGKANYGYCASKDMHYFGYKLVAVTTCQGLPVVYDLVPANVDERLAAETVIDHLRGCHIFGDKGFLGKEWQANIFQQTANQFWTPKRTNQYEQNPVSLDRWINGLRERIERVFHEIQNTGRNIERLLAKTVLGLYTRIIVKMIGYVLKYLQRYRFHVNIQSFQYNNTFAKNWLNRRGFCSKVGFTLTTTYTQKAPNEYFSTITTDTKQYFENNHATDEPDYSSNDSDDRTGNNARIISLG